MKLSSPILASIPFWSEGRQLNRILIAPEEVFSEKESNVTDIEFTAVISFLPLQLATAEP